MTAFDDNMLELLGGYLDGELDGEDLRRVEQLLAADPKFRALHRELLAMREALTNLPRATLPSTFAEKVLSQVKVRADQMGAEVPVWVRPPIRLPDDSFRSTQKWARILVVGLAAMLAGVAVIWREVIESPRNERSVAKLTENPSMKDSIASDAGSSAGLDESGTGVRESTGVAAIETIAEVVNSPSSNDAETPALDTQVVESSKRDLVVAGSENQNSENQNSLAMDESVDTKVQESPIGSGKIATVMTAEEQQMMRATSELLERGDRLRLLTIVDLTATSEAWEEKTVELILNKYDIAMESPVLVTERMQEDLRSSRMIGTVDVAESVEERVALVYVKAKSDRLDLAIREMIDREDDFPRCMMDIAMDLPGQEAIKNLESIREFADAEIGGERRLGVARSLVRTSTDRPNGLVAQFPAPKPRGLPGNRNRRDDLAPTKSSALDMNPVSYCLLIIRAP